MNITYIIGNGFDINLGLKTKYSDFYEYYKGVATTYKDIIKLKEDIKNNISLWSDLEKRLGEYTTNVSSSEIMKILFDDIADNLTEYIKEQILTIPESSEKAKESLLNDLASPEKYFARTDKDEITKFYNSIGGHSSINIISFNYTPTIEKILGENYSNIKLKEKYFNDTIPTIKNIYHIHHSLDGGHVILLGVNDETQIINEEIRKDLLLREYIINPVANKVSKTGIDTDCTDIINCTNLFIIFGVSFGETDKKWWNLINKRLLSKELGSCRALIFDFKIGNVNKRMLGEYERNAKYKLSSHIKITDEELEILCSKIYVTINGDIFKDIKEHIHILQDQHGTFTINYSNNNGEYIIGHNKKKFTTKWSKADDKSIHAYNDAKDIDSIGLISNLTDLSKLNIHSVNFSSRSRTPRIGDCVVWKNIYGNNAITKIKGIKDDTRNDDVDELVCEYVIYK